MVTATTKKIISQRKKMSYEEYLEAAGDSQIVEWVDGEVIYYMPPADLHQDLSRFLSSLLDSYIQFFHLGALRYAPFEVKLWPDGPSREPDILFIAKENLSRLTDKRCEGPPDLIIEIVSPGSVSEDRVRKFNHYEQAGVGEYWIVDPRLRQQQVDFYVLGEDRRFQAAPLGEDGRYQSTVLPNFCFNIDWLWQKTLANPQLAFAEIMVSLTDLSDEVRATYQKLIEILSST